MRERRENRAPAERMSEGRQSASVRERPQPSATSGVGANGRRARKSRTVAEAQKRDKDGTRGNALRGGVESALDLLAGVHALLPAGPVPRAEVEALLLLVQARLHAALTGGAA